MINRYFALLILIFITSSGCLLSQSKTNLELFYSLADSSVTKLKDKDVCLKVSNSSQYTVFNNTVYKTAEANGIKNCSGDESNFISLSFDKAVVTYPEMFRSGFMGAHLVKREVRLSGNLYSVKEGYKEFSFASIDTVRVDEIKNLEDPSFLFTKGEIPAEPFFSGIVEPIAAIGAAAAIIILYFTVRSK